jgi:hypothetical protein
LLLVFSWSSGQTRLMTGAYLVRIKCFHHLFIFSISQIEDIGKEEKSGAL